ncbi:MAG: FkbM family methyltransferase [Verrucomicrobiota bacterium]|jgi:FkbM family methyltransferase
MQLFHRLRKVTNELLSPLGLSVERVEKRPWFRPEIVTTRVGKYDIRVPAANPLSRIYLENPGYASYLGALAALLMEKYKNLIAMDVGANVGDTACIIESSASIPLLCIEGDDLCFTWLEQNLRQFPQATAYRVFLGEKSETLDVSTEKDGWNTTLIPNRSGPSKGIQLLSLDDFLSSRPETPNLKLLKIDTEGFDCSIIRGARNFIRQVRPVITFEYNRDNMAVLGEPGLDTLDMLATLGYDCVAVHDCAGRFFDAASLSDDRFVRNIHDYADGKHAAVYYFDLTLFHESDQDVARAFVNEERGRRAGDAANSLPTPCAARS